MRKFLIASFLAASLSLTPTASRAEGITIGVAVTIAIADWVAAVLFSGVAGFLGYVIIDRLDEGEPRNAVVHSGGGGGAGGRIPKILF